MKLDAKAKGIIRKNGRFHSCAYVYKDGIALSWEETHYYKGEAFTKQHKTIYPGENKIFITHPHDEKFVGRLVLHNPTLVLDGIDTIEIYRGNKSEKMERMGISCNTVTLNTMTGVKIHEDIFEFMTSDIVIQNDHNMSISDWEDVENV